MVEDWNPYYDEWRARVGHEPDILADGEAYSRWVRVASTARTEMVRRYAWSIPCPEALDLIEHESKGRIVVEFGSIDDLERIVALMAPDAELPSDLTGS